MKMRIKNEADNASRAKEGRIAGAASAASAGGSIAGIHNVCHSICMLAVSVLSVVGITIASDALMWLQGLALPFWTFGVAMLAATLLMRMRMGPCISLKLIVANTGLLIVGVPFVQLQALAPLFWATGAGVTAYALLWYFNERFSWNLENKLGR